ncbi:Zn-dependent amino-or carboxypeptidase, M28 family [Chitinophaga rupis]|uniref:Zn-dependent amino-or carboxypeptidase, M28 family n=1 Tax=Chitinophaga rupis TaxID=573321 RepID=A0A1H7HNJ0_9BACT|nr:M28 family metallopeptidase [Chitinophaga rupis]SEK51926.1 Zn-dependent amino-or carboxypeptidase, M28 family [Chitinophaga rupis]
MQTCYRLLLIAALALGACNRPGKNAAALEDSTAFKAITEEGFRQHLNVLAADSFEGRKPFTAGEEKTIRYLETQFKQLGLQPGNGNSYVQEVPMVEITSEPAGPLVFKGKGGQLSLKYLDDYVATTRRVTPKVQLNNSELIFAGYGIVAPEYNWNDYAGLDVKGKTVVVLVNDPGFADTALFKGHTMTYYGRWTYKYEEAARQGAAGIIIIHDTAPASYPWAVVRSGWSGAKLYLQTEDNDMSRAGMEGWITLDAAKKLFQLAGVSDTLMQSARKPGFKPVHLPVTASVVINNKLKKSTSHNVLAVWPGATKPNEYIIYSAHWDHLGIGEAIKGDSIYNGAADNATGTVALLEIAKAFTKLQQRPARSILFIGLTGEEQGLLGSEYYATHPVFPKDSTVADINMDVLNTYGRTKDITIVGLGQSELDDYAERAAAKQGRTISLDENPSAGHFFRSDHFNFAKVGIPALYAGSGTQSLEHDTAWAKTKIEEYGRDRYHSPFDQVDSTWEYSGMVEDAQLLFDVGHTLSNETTFPAWKQGSEFKAAREKK